MHTEERPRVRSGRKFRFPLGRMGRNAGAIVLAAVGVSAVGLVIVEAEAVQGPATRTENTVEVSYTGGYQDVTVPPYADQARVTVAGGGGGSTCVSGGRGSVVTGIVRVSVGETLRIGVGGHGTTRNSGGGEKVSVAGGWGADGATGGSATVAFRLGRIASGGGGSAVEVNGAQVMIAGGGGGGGMCQQKPGGRGGSNGPGEPGQKDLLAGGGRGGVFSAGSARHGEGAENGGAGGGGSVGGGAGVEGANHFFAWAGAGGGGAGSSWTQAGRVEAPVTSADGPNGAGFARIEFLGERVCPRGCPTLPPPSVERLDG